MTNSALTPRQRAQLRSLAHHLKPIHHIGKEGFSPAAIDAIRELFNHRELIKVRVQDTAPVTVRDAGNELTSMLPGVHHVQTIGKVIVFYRRHPEKPAIVLTD